MPYTHVYGDLLCADRLSSLRCQELRCSTALVVLNSPERSLSCGQLRVLATICGVVVAADGGANWLQQADIKPTCVVGDMDSVATKTIEAYTAARVVCQHEHDDSRTDFQKALDRLPDDCTRAIVVGGDGGRLDHLLANFHAMHFDAMRCSQRDILLLSRNSIAFVLRPGGHTIKIDKNVEGPTCGMFPLGGPCNVRTHNLRWEVNSEALDGRPLQFGTYVSSSNQFAGDSVLIWTDSFLLWTHELRWPESAEIEHRKLEVP